MVYLYLCDLEGLDPFYNEAIRFCLPEESTLDLKVGYKSDGSQGVLAVLRNGTGHFVTLDASDLSDIIVAIAGRNNNPAATVISGGVQIWIEGYSLRIRNLAGDTQVQLDAVAVLQLEEIVKNLAAPVIDILQLQLSNGMADPNWQRWLMPQTIKADDYISFELSARRWVGFETWDPSTKSAFVTVGDDSLEQSVRMNKRQSKDMHELIHVFGVEVEESCDVTYEVRCEGHVIRLAPGMQEKVLPKQACVEVWGKDENGDVFFKLTKIEANILAHACRLALELELYFD